MSVEKHKVPAIRFKKVSGEWENKAIQDLIDEQAIISHLDGNHGELYPRSNEFSDVGIPYIAANDFANGFVNFSKCKYLPITKAKKFKKGIAKDGDVLFAHNATVGPVAKLRTELDFVILSTTATYFRCDNKTLINNYLLQVLSETKFIEQYTRVMSQSTRNQVPITTQRKFFISIPKSSTEQTKIGNYFQQLDILISQHQQKHDKLLTIKKALLEKMFPKQGKIMPSIRFKEGSGKWEERELLSNFEKIIDFRGRTPKKLGLDWSETGYLALSALNVKNGYIDLNMEAHYGDQELYDKWMSGNELHRDQVLFTTEAPMGNVAQVPDKKKYILSQRTIAFEVQPKLITENFLTVMLRSPLMLQKLTSLSSGGTAKGVSQKSLAAVDVLIPKEIIEQTKIGNLFKHLDTLLNHHKTQIKKLKNIKQACLEKMFV